jgi:acetyl-CoA C-acetyltransferase
VTAAAIVGAGALPVGRHSDRLEHELVLDALLAAVQDAGVTKDLIDALVFSTPRPYTQQRYFGTFIAGYLGLPVSDLVVEVLGDGMTGGLALDTAISRVEQGEARVAVALGVSRELDVPTAQHMELTMRAVGDVDFHVPFGPTPIAWYAFNATRYLHEFGATRADLAAVAVKNREHARRNPLAQFRDPITVEDVLSSRPIVRPLHLLDVTPRSDGAAAIVVAEASLARRLRPDPVYVVGRGFHHEGVHMVSPTPRDLTWYESAELAAAEAYDASGVGPEDLSLAEVYAPCTIVEVILTEALGLCAPGEGAVAAREGATRLGGRIPVSTSGGCLSRGHPPMVTPLYNAYEAVQQLRGSAGERQVPDARLGAITAELGDYNATMLHVLAREPLERWV